MEITLKQLECFELVAQLGSLSKAATASECAQSLISRNISNLEKLWGDRLFDRTGRGVTITEFGLQMLNQTSLVLKQIQQLNQMAKEVGGSPSGTVHLGVQSSLSKHLLPRLYADLKQNSPSIMLHVTEGFSGSLDEQISTGRLDIAIVNRYGASTKKSEDHLGFVETLLVGKRGSFGLNESTIRLKEAIQLPLVLPSRPNGLRLLLDNFSREKKENINVVMEVDTLSSMKEIAASGHALTILPWLAVESDLERLDLSYSRIVKPEIKRIVAMTYSTQRPLTKAAKYVSSRIKSIITGVLKDQYVP